MNYFPGMEKDCKKVPTEAKRKRRVANVLGIMKCL